MAVNADIGVIAGDQRMAGVGQRCLEPLQPCSIHHVRPGQHADIARPPPPATQQGLPRLGAAVEM